ncbi:MAG TPA: PQQ-binding-like beta-propeller repeat protein [bacterium]|nr:PQQ-binding-like beta-propeller repeat protein [bacterium]
MSETRSALILFSAVLLLMVASCKNRPPSAPAIPTGPPLCVRGTNYAFSTIATDPEGDSVAVRFNWGNSDTSDWSAWFAGGDVIALTHTWPDTGNCQVTAQARDQKLNTSGWSEALAIRVGYRAPSVPVGPDSCLKDRAYTFKTIATDPYIDSVSIRFAWGYNDTSDWSSLVPASESVAMDHTWSAIGSNNVAAQARDRKLNLSGWSDAHAVQVVNAGDTLRLWRTQIKGGVTSSNVSSPAIGPDSTIYVGSQDGNLYAVKKDGALKWTFTTGGPIRSSPAIAADGTIYFGSTDFNLYAVRPDGALKWTYRTHGEIPSSPAITADGTIVFGSKDSNIYALDTAGSVKWAYPGGDFIYSSPAIGPDGSVYVGCYDNYLYALTASGALKWRYLTGGHVHSSPAVATDGTIYFGSFDGSLYALNPDSSLKWTVLTSGQVEASPSIGPDGTIYVGSTDKLLYAVNPSGTIKWRYATGGGVISSPAVSSNGTIYFGSDDDTLYALGSDSTPLYKYPTGSCIESAPTIGPDGTVYFVGWDGYLYALKGKGTLAGSSWPKFHHDIGNSGRFGAKR